MTSHVHAQKLHLNHGRYAGETIAVESVLADCLRLGRSHGWDTDSLRTENGLELVTLRRPGKPGGSNLYISTGIHGDEPAGPLAARQLLREDAWPPELSLWMCPCLNPSGFPLNRRENAEGADLNRDYRHLTTAEIQAHVGWLGQQPRFDLTLCLHEDWESAGFYVYELNPEARPSLAEDIIQAAARVCPIETAEIIEERPAKGGIIRPSVDPNARPQWPEAFYLLRNKTPQSYTLEAPSDYPLAVRVAALVAGVRAAARRLAQVSATTDVSSQDGARTNENCPSRSASNPA